MSDIHKTFIEHPVLVYRPEIDKWDGPFFLLDVCEEVVMGLASKRETTFRSTVVKPYETD